MNKNTRYEICPNCEKECYAETIDENRIVTVNEDDIEVAVHLLRCVECHEEFEDRNQRMDELDIAYREYRRRHNMIQPEDITIFLKKLHLNHEQFGKLLGITAFEASAYELGLFQDKAHDTVFKAFRICANVLDKKTTVQTKIKELLSIGLARLVPPKLIEQEYSTHLVNIMPILNLVASCFRNMSNSSVKKIISSTFTNGNVYGR